MTLKWIGAIIIITGCGGFGFSMAAAHKREERELISLIRAVEYMICELEHRMTPLPELCRLAGQGAGGGVGNILCALASHLEECSASDVSDCMVTVLNSFPQLPWRTGNNLKRLGQTLGKFALSGQVSGFQAIISLCKRDLDSLSQDAEAKRRGYRTLGICAGVALVILFL